MQPKKCQESIKRFNAEPRVGRDVTVGGFDALQKDVRADIQLDVAGVWIQVTMLGGVAVQAGADADHAVGFLEQLQRGAGAVETGDAGVEVGVGEPVLGHQGGGNQGADAVG
jgi:hypothetical protein